MSWHYVQHKPSMTHLEYCIHREQHTPSTAHTEYSIHPVHHTPSTAYTKYNIHQLQHTPSTAYTKYSIHRVHHTPSTASTQECLSSFHCHDWEFTPECYPSFRRASLHDQPPSGSWPWELIGKVTLWHPHVCESANCWIESQHPAHCPLNASKYSLNLVRLRPPTASHHKVDHGPEVYLHTRLIMASNFAWLWPTSVSPNSLDYDLGVNL